MFRFGILIGFVAVACLGLFSDATNSSPTPKIPTFDSKKYKYGIVQLNPDDKFDTCKSACWKLKWVPCSVPLLTLKTPGLALEYVDSSDDPQLFLQPEYYYGTNLTEIGYCFCQEAGVEFEYQRYETELQHYLSRFLNVQEEIIKTFTNAKDKLVKTLPGFKKKQKRWNAYVKFQKDMQTTIKRMHEDLNKINAASSLSFDDLKPRLVRLKIKNRRTKIWIENFGEHLFNELAEKSMSPEVPKELKEAYEDTMNIDSKIEAQQDQVDFLLNEIKRCQMLQRKGVFETKKHVVCH